MLRPGDVPRAVTDAGTGRATARRPAATSDPADDQARLGLGGTREVDDVVRVAGEDDRAVRQRDDSDDRVDDVARVGGAAEDTGCLCQFDPYRDDLAAVQESAQLNLAASASSG